MKEVTKDAVSLMSDALEIHLKSLLGKMEGKGFVWVFY